MTQQGQSLIETLSLPSHRNKLAAMVPPPPAKPGDSFRGDTLRSDLVDRIGTSGGKKLF